MLRNPRIRIAAVVLSLVVWLGVAGVGGQAQGKLSEVQQNDAAAFLPSSAESTLAGKLADEFVTSPTLPTLVVLQPAAGGQVSAEQTAAVQAFAADLSSRPVIAGGETWGDVLVSDPVVAPSEDGQALLLVLAPDAARADERVGEDRLVQVLVNDLRTGLADTLGATADSAGPLGLNAWVTGPAGFVVDLVNAFGGIDGVLLGVALGAVLLILVLVYRSPFLPFVVILNAVFALSLAGLVVYWLARSGVLVLNGQAQGILSILVVGASVDYALLLVARYREELGRHDVPAVAAGYALRRSFEPIVASAGTVIAGLLCLLLSDLASNRSLGPVAAIGILSALVAAFTLLPALLLAPGRHARVLFWPRAPRPTAEEGAADAQAGVSAGWWARIAALVSRHARPVWIATAVALAIGAAFVPTLQAGGSNQVDVFRTPVDSVAGQEVLAEHFPVGAVQPAVVVVPQGEADVTLAAIRALDTVQQATLYTGVPAGVPGADQAPPLVVDDRVRIDVVTAASADSQQGVEQVRDLRAAVHAATPDALVGGAAAQTLDTELAAQRDLRVIVPLVLLVISVILMLLLRSVTSAVVLVAATVLSFGTALGTAALVFNHVLHLPAADPVVPLYAFVFLVALGVDYSIFLMTRVREEAIRSDTRTGVVVGLTVTGGVITSAGIVLAATFAALSVIPLLFLQQLAFVVAFGVLLDTLIVRTLLVPALVHDLDARVWWPSRLSRGVALRQ